MIRVSVTLATLVLAATACGTRAAPDTHGAPSPEGAPTAAPATGTGTGQGADTPTATATGGPTYSADGMQSPGAFRLQYDGEELVLRPHTWCHDSGCVDGFAEDPPSVGSPAAIRILVPVEDWNLAATFTPAGERCGREHTVKPVKTDGWYTLRPAGPAARYDVTLFAQGVGDMVAAFRWTTPTDGELPTPRARLAVIADHDETPDSYGVELMVSNLAETPDSAAAEITVTAGNGRSLTFDATRARGNCWPDGTVSFDGPDKSGLAAAALGGFPFHYAVTLTLDGKTYRSSADYPADEIHGYEPSVALRFSPALPALE